MLKKNVGDHMKNMNLVKDNQKILKYEKKKNIFYINLFEKLELKIDDTYDLTHLNPKGSSKLSNVIFENLKNYVIFH